MKWVCFILDETWSAFCFRLSPSTPLWWTQWTCGRCVGWDTLLDSSSNSSKWLCIYALLDFFGFFGGGRSVQSHDILGTLWCMAGAVLCQSWTGWRHLLIQSASAESTSTQTCGATLTTGSTCSCRSTSTGSSTDTCRRTHLSTYRPVLGDHAGLLPRLLSSAVCFSFVYVWHGEHLAFL